MMLFSQRKGIKVKNVLQVDSMDNELRTRLWNTLTIFYWERVTRPPVYGGHEAVRFIPEPDHDNNMNVLIRRLWHNCLKRPIDTLRDNWSDTCEKMRKHFFNCEWDKVYDFIEFIANNYPEINHYDKSRYVNPKFMNACNSVLKEESSAYRFVGGKIAELISEEEIAEIDEALQTPIKAVNIHIKRALDLLSDRKCPDYRNSIKESISAVEAICKLIANDPKAKLGNALKAIESKVGLHPAFKNAIDNLYAYASNEQGIRHSLLDEPNLDYEDSRFMLVTCSAFINYLISKSSKAGIEF